MKRFLIAAAVVLASVTPAFAQDDGFGARLDSLDGYWEGYLEYRDYQSDEIQRIPMTRRVSTAPDSSYAITELTFSDPGTQILAAEITAVSGDEVRLAFTREGYVETETYQIAAFLTEETGWSLTLEARGWDDEGEADIRILMTLDGDTLTTEKRVRPDGTQDYVYRNRSVVERAG